MLLQRTDKPLNNYDNICELKIDGIRLILSTVGDKTNLYTRHNTPCNTQFPELLDIGLPPDTILDGEVCVTDNQGKPCFESVSKRFQTSNTKKIDILKYQLPIQYCVFDVIRYKGKDVYNLPLLERKEILNDITENNHISLVRWMDGDNSEELFNLVKQEALEGIVVKRKNSSYQINKRSWDWQKIVNYQYYQVVIMGIKKREHGVLISFPNEASAGTIEFPFPPKERRALWGLINQLKLDEDKNVIYLDSKLMIEVKSRGVTKNGYIRTPSFHRYCI
nr:RNA ligase family protein [Shimazuella kribbensis]